MFSSIIICTHNPIPEYLNRTISALKEQTLALEDWELILVDNVSTTPVSEVYYISWHPHGKHVIEQRLGLTFARLKGIEKAKGDIILFVDDDNCLNPDYLTE